MSVDDYLVALKLHKQLNERNNQDDGSFRDEVDVPAPTTSIVDPEWEITDPNPDIHTLFRVFNVKFFWNKLGAVEVKWSPRMYTCAGICTYKGAAGCVVSLSLPLLKFRPRKDLVETLLHEMIHAYLFVTKNNRDRSGHGPEFCKHMNRINRDSGTHITIYHAFHDEVDHYRGHVWRCSGKCQADPPYFGYVRRATNRAPGPNDFWFPQHLSSCGGSFLKVREPDGFKAKPRKKMRTDDSDQKQITPTNTLPRGQKDLRNFFSSSSSSVGTPKAKVDGKFSSSIRSLKGSVGGLVKTVKGAQSSESDQGPSVVSHGGLMNNIHGFGKSEGRGGGCAGAAVAVKREVIPFSGKGNVLGSGGGGRGRSRLLPDSELSSNSSSSPVTPSTSTPSKNSDNFVEDLTAFDSDDGSTQSEEGGGLVCPVCSCEIGGNTTLNEHLDDCGVLDQVFNSSTHSDALSSDEEVEANSYEQASTVLVSDSSSESPSESAEPVVRPHYSPPFSPPVSCPNCPAVFTNSTINRHLDQCLSFE